MNFILNLVNYIMFFYAIFLFPELSFLNENCHFQQKLISLLSAFHTIM